MSGPEQPATAPEQPATAAEKQASATKRHEMVYAVTKLMKDNEELGAVVLLFTNGYGHVLSRSASDLESVPYGDTGISGWCIPRGTCKG
jgi:hypothetical protein